MENNYFDDIDDAIDVIKSLNTNQVVKNINSNI